MCIIYVYLYSLLRTFVAIIMFSFWKFSHQQKGYITGAVCILLLDLTYPCWYSRVSSGKLDIKYTTWLNLILYKETRYYNSSDLLLRVRNYKHPSPGFNSMLWISEIILHLQRLCHYIDVFTNIQITWLTFIVLPWWGFKTFNYEVTILSAVVALQGWIFITSRVVITMLVHLVWLELPYILFPPLAVTVILSLTFCTLYFIHLASLLLFR